MKSYLQVSIAALFMMVFFSLTIQAETDYRFNLLSTKDGLPSTEITAIIQQRNGFIWIGTDRGVSRFDGQNYEHFHYAPGSPNHISNNFVTAIIEDKEENIWIGTENGLNKILKNGEIKIYTHAEADVNSIPQDWITTLFESSDGTLWIGTGYELIKYSSTTESFTRIKTTSYVKSIKQSSILKIFQTSKGNILVARSSGLYEINSELNSYHLLKFENSGDPVFENYISSLAELPGNLIALGTENSGIILFDLKSGVKSRLTQKNEPDGLSSNYIYSLLTDKNGNLWIGYANHGLSLYNHSSKNITHIKKKDFDTYSLPTDSIRDLFIDRAGILWIGTADGIAIYSPFISASRIFHQRPDNSELSSNYVYQHFHNADGSVWISSEAGLNLISKDRKSVIQYPLKDESGKLLNDQEVWQIAQAKDNMLWLATEQGLLKFNPENGLSKSFYDHPQLPKNAFYTLLANNDGSIWITGYMDVGLILFDEKKGVIKSFLRGSGSRYWTGGNFTSAKIRAKDGSILMATTDGIFRINPNNGVDEHYSLAKDRDNIRTTSIVQDDKGSIWIATQGLGLVRLELKNDLSQQVNMEFLDTSNGFPSNEFKSLINDGEYLWATTKDTIIKINKETKQWEGYPNLLNMSGLTFIENGGSIHDNFLYLSSSQGLITVNIEKILKNNYKPQIKITKAVSENRELFIELDSDLAPETEISYEENDIELFFASLDYSNPGNNKYRYILEGADDEWSQPTFRTNVKYNNLPSGQYTFRVQGSNSEGDWSHYEASYHFKIKYPWWLWVLITLAVLTLLVIIIYLLDRRKHLHYLHHKANIDALTGIANRYSFSNHLTNLLNSSPTQFGLAVIDLDTFKEVNDTFGHHIGDSLLIEVTERIQSCIRKTDFLARLGGDEFALIITQFNRLDDVIDVTDRIRERLQRNYSLAGNEIAGSASIGVAVYPNDGTDNQTLLTNADTAMYAAKNGGKNSVCFFNESLSEALGQKLRVRANLKFAVKNNELQLHYQPKVNQFTNKVVGVEALVRWIHPQDGFMAPDLFITEAESNGTIIEIGEWVLRTACHQARNWNQNLDQPFKVAVNVSAVQIAQPNFIETVFSILEETSVNPHLIELEITESVLIESRKNCQASFELLREKGISIALDDFGVGFSSLSYLTQYSIDILKIDRSFIVALEKGGANLKVLKHIYSLANDLEMQIVAEGVETQAQLEMLAEFNGALIQGYFYSPPKKANEIDTIVQNNCYFTSNASLSSNDIN